MDVTPHAATEFGIVGMGAAGWAFLPAIRGNPASSGWLAVTEPADEAAIDGIAAETGVAVHADLASLLRKPGVDAVYIATPTELHPDHVAQVCAAGKHVLTEKPMAIRVEQAQAMVDAAERAGVVLQVGHSHSYDLPIAADARDRALGRARPVAHDPHLELHRLDGAPAPARRARHRPGRRRHLPAGRASGRHPAADRRRPGQERARDDLRLAREPPLDRCAHDLPELRDGTAATAVYNGYGHLPGSELTGGVGEWGVPEMPGRRVAPKPTAPLTPEQELAAKRKRARTAIPASAPHQPHFGLTLVSCERGDIRQSSDGLLVYSEDGRDEIALPNDKSPRDLVLAEFAQAIAGRPVTHTGRWGLANLEVCTAAIESSRTGQEIELRYQVPVVD